MESNPQKIENIKTVIEKLNAIHFTDVDFIDKNIFSFESIKNGNITKLKVDKHTLVILDTPDFNSCYLLESFMTVKDKLNSQDETIDELKKLFGFTYPKDHPTITEEEFSNVVIDFISNAKSIVNDIQIMYCDTPQTHKYLLSGFLGKDKVEERPLPMVLIINHEVNEIFIDYEKFMPLSLSNFFAAIMMIFDAKKIQENIRQDVERKKALVK